MSDISVPGSGVDVSASQYIRDSASAAIGTATTHQELNAVEAFAALDLAGNGVLNLQDVGALGQIMGKSMTKRELTAAFDEMDLDGDG